MSNRRVIFWLLVTTLALVAAEFFLTWRQPSVAAAARQFLLDPAFETRSVSLARPGEPTTVLARDDGRWSLVAPYAGTVESRTVLRLLDAFSFSAAEDALSDAELFRLGRNRADFGLDAPRLTVTFSNEVETVSLSFGHETPMSNGVYAVRRGSDAVLVVPQAVFDAANLGSDALRERAVFPYEPEFIVGFDVKRPNASLLSFVRDGESWRIGESVASASKVKEFLSLVSDTRAVDFVWPVGATNESVVASSALLSGYGLDADSALAITLRCQDGVDRRLLLGQSAGVEGNYALIHGGAAIVTVPPRLKAVALQNAQAFTDMRLFPLDESAVASFSISDGLTSYVVARSEGGAWRLDAPVAAPADAEFVSGVLGRLLAMTPADLDPKGLKVSVLTNFSSCVVSSRSLLGGGRLDDLRSREILKIDPTLVKRLVVTSEAGGSPVALVRLRERRVWTVESEDLSERAVDTAAVSAVLTALDPLVASSIVVLKASAADLARYGLEKPFYTLAVDQEKEGAVRRNILIGAETKGGRYATVGSSEAVFVLPKKTVSALTAGLLEE